MSNKPGDLCPPGVVLTAAQLNAKQYTPSGIYHREADPGWEAKRDAGLGITPLPTLPGEVTLGNVVPSAGVVSLNRVLDIVKDMAVAKETEPNGLSPHTAGAKLDAGKNRLGLVFTDFAKAIEQVGLVATMGAAKYTASGWVSVKDGKERYTDALFRHLVAHAAGERVDASGLLHLAHAAWNVLAVLELELRTLTPEQRLERK